MRITFAACLLGCLSQGVLAGDEADPKAPVSAAIEALARQPSYTWKTTVESARGGGPFGGGNSTTTGKIEKDGFLWVVTTGSDALELAAKGGKFAVSLDGNWMTTDQAVSRGGAGGRGQPGSSRFNSEAAAGFKTPSAQLEELIAKAAKFRQEGEAIVGEIPADAAAEMLSAGGRRFGRGRGGPNAGGVKDPRGSITFNLAGGTVAQVKLALGGSREIRGEVIKLDRTVTMHFSDIGATKVALPPDAKTIIEALLEGKPSPVFVPEPGFKKLFNGRDLAGWSGGAEHWSVMEGAITGRPTAGDPTKRSSFLIAKDGEENLVGEDFELRLSFRIVGRGTTGSGGPAIFYRGKEVPGPGVEVFQLNLESAPRQAEDGWSDLVIIARGDRREHIVNGSKIAVVLGQSEEIRSGTGILAFVMQPGSPATVQVKDIRWRPLDTPDLEGASNLRAAKGFAVELIYTVPKESEGSWVSLCVDPKGRLIAGDQNGGLFRVTLPGAGNPTTRVERIGVEIGGAHGLLWAFDSLYVVVNERSPRGLFRVRDTDGDDRLDKVELLRDLRGGGEHGVHSLVPSPDGKSLFLVAGNSTPLTKCDSSRAPLHWGEDDLLARLPTGFMDDSYAPQGWIASTDPDGKSWELIAMGFRNPFDIAFNKAGELFTYDADMEWDIGDPWYRPTRVNHVVSGGEFGFRNGNGKWPAFAVDSFGAVADVGPGSPTGIAFGYGAKFPAKHQEALYIADWSFGKLRAVHLIPGGASYTGEVEDFVSGQPFPITDFLVNPHDGAMYAAVGGRGAQSALYRITYRGSESTAPSTLAGSAFQASRDLRHKLEGFHGRKDPAAVEAVWQHLGDADRAIRFAARVALEWQDVPQWRAKALREKEPRKAIAALVALARASGRDAIHQKKDDPSPDAALRAEILAALDAIDWASLSHADRLDLLRAYWLALTRLGRPDDPACVRLVSRFDPLFPAKSVELNWLLSQLLIYLEAPSAAAKVVAALRDAPTQEEQIDYAVALRVLKTGWTMPLREEYFRWFVKAQGYRGGNTFAGSLRRARDNAVALLSEEEKAALKPILDARSERKSQPELLELGPVVKEWTLEDVLPIAERGLRGGRSFERGRKLYAKVACASCHRFANEGGSVGPDLSGVAGRFGVRDLLEAVVQPSKTISDQYESVVIRKKNGQIVTGRIGNLGGSGVSVVESMLDPGAMTNVQRAEIVSIEPSKLSPMPEGLFNTLKEEEIQDLVAYLLSRGDPENAMFR